MAVGLECKSLLACGVVDHQRLSVLHVLDYLIPQEIAYASRDVSDVDAGTDLE